MLHQTVQATVLRGLPVQVSSAGRRLCGESSLVEIIHHMCHHLDKQCTHIHVITCSEIDEGCFGVNS